MSVSSFILSGVVNKVTRSSTKSVRSLSCSYCMCKVIITIFMMPE